MLTLDFEGWFQMRMATDPDPTEDPRGVSGYTFALAGEPDFDGRVHLQPDEPGVWEREFGPRRGERGHGPSVGVTVRNVQGSERQKRLLHGARVAFVNAEVKERNGLLVRDDFFAIDPLLVRVFSADGSELLLERDDLLDPQRPELTIFECGTKELLRRQPKGFVRNSEEVARATKLNGSNDLALIVNRMERQTHLLELQRSYERGSADWEALQTRITQLDNLRQWWNLSEQGRPIDRRAYMLGMLCHGWDVDVNGPVTANRLDADPSKRWPLRFWLGGWDGDALCGYIKGTWEIAVTSS